MVIDYDTTPMKTNIYLVMILTAGVLALMGCGKSGDAKPGAVPPGVVDLGSLQQAFPEPTPEVTTTLNKLRFSVRYRQLQPALVELEKLSKLPNLTEPQKKAVNDVIEQVKVAIKTLPAPPTQ